MNKKEQYYKNKLIGVKNRLIESLERAEDGEITFEVALENISPRDILTETTIIPTMWSIDDLRDKFPEHTSDRILTLALKDLERALQDASVRVGHEVIEDILEVDEFLNELATCGICGETFHENEINMIDYDIDTCRTCEIDQK
jgi:hypothetical protein